MARLLRRRAGNRPTPATPIQVHTSDDQGEVRDLDVDRYARLVADALAAQGVHGPGEANLLFVDRDAIAQLKRVHMGGTGATDVLSFPLDGAEPLAPGDEQRMVGDLVICPGVARDQAADHAGDLDAELALLVVHGVLHLCGHDHAEPDERDAMWGRERELLDELWGPLPRDPWRAAS
jgi:probable rRNA maturation factor